MRYSGKERFGIEEPDGLSLYLPLEWACSDPGPQTTLPGRLGAQNGNVHVNVQT